jgi:mannose-1-phosphate guanylyltransferase
MKVVIFAGGVGTRLWPLSRQNTPKQFGKIIGDKSTLQLAYDRVSPIFKPQDIYVSSGKRYKDVIKDQLPMLPVENLIFEPEMRDVGAAVGLVGAILDKVAPDEPFIILWSDQIVKQEKLFRNILKLVGEMLNQEKNKIIFIAHNSRFASQNLGWIERGERVRSLDGFEMHEFKSWHYRPDQKTAQEFHESERHYWNPGYFGTTARFLFSLYKKFAPEMAEKLIEIRDSYQTPEFEKKLDKLYPLLEKISFDNLILEKIDPKDGYVVASDFGWSDVGAWESLKEALQSSGEANVEKGKVMLNDCTDSLVFNYTDKMIVGIDLDQYLVINTDDVLLVCPKNSVPKIKKLVEGMNGTEHEDLV